MTTAAWFQCSAGVAGDMTMAALVDAGADQFSIINAVQSLDIEGWAITFEEVQRCGVRATWANVVVHDHDAVEEGVDRRPQRHQGRQGRSWRQTRQASPTRLRNCARTP